MKTIHIRETRAGERFNVLDKYIAWYDGEAAGAMGPSEEQAVLALLNPNRLDPARVNQPVGVLVHFAHPIGARIKIIDLDSAPGVVEAMSFNCDGKSVRVAYWHEGRRYSEWIREDEIRS